MGRALTGVWREKDRQITSMAAVLIVLFIFCIFLGRVAGLAGCGTVNAGGQMSQGNRLLTEGKFHL